MAYTVRKGKLHFVVRTGNGPCNRRHVGQRNRRILWERKVGGVEYSYHATKGYRATRVEAA